jgi:hypothetical protein
MAAEPVDALLEANERFYAAFSQRDFALMNAVWHSTLPLVCIHPGWPPLEGRERVLDSWRGILGNPSSPTVRCVRPKAHLMNDFGLVVCFEGIGRNRLVATNGFARTGDAWAMVFHQAGPVAQGDEEEDEDDEPEISPSELN